MTTLAAFLVALFAAFNQPQPVRAGVMVADAGTKVVALEGAALAPGTPVTVVGIEERQDVWQAAIARQLPASDAMAKHMVAGTSRRIRLCTF